MTQSEGSNNKRRAVSIRRLHTESVLFAPCPTCGPRPVSHMAWKTGRMTAGWIDEQWYCRDGCQQYFTTHRNTITNEFRLPRIPPEQGK